MQVKRKVYTHVPETPTNINPRNVVKRVRVISSSPRTSRFLHDTGLFSSKSLNRKRNRKGKTIINKTTKRK